MAVLRRVALCAVALMLTAACRTGQEQWGPFRGQVIDAETREPIAGAYVMVMWIRDRPALHSGQSFYDARETRTDGDGRFEIPYERRWLTIFVTEPAIAVFAPNYVMEEEVVARDGRPYIDSTLVHLRRLRTPEEKCRSRGLSRPPIEAHPLVPQYVDSQLSYAAALECR